MKRKTPNEEVLELSEVGLAEGITNKELVRCLKEIEFPITKEELVLYAMFTCSEDLIGKIKKTNQEIFHNIGEVEEYVF